MENKKYKLAGKLIVEYSESGKCHIASYTPPVIEPFYATGSIKEINSKFQKYISDMQIFFEDEVFLASSKDFLRTHYIISDFKKKLDSAIAKNEFEIIDDIDVMKIRIGMFINNYMANNQTGFFMTNSDLKAFDKIIKKTVINYKQKQKEAQRAEFIEFAKKHLSGIISKDDAHYNEKIEALAESYANFEINGYPLKKEHTNA